VDRSLIVCHAIEYHLTDAAFPNSQMIIGHRDPLHRIFVFSLIAVVIVFGGCWLAAEPVPLVYTRVTTAAGPSDLGEPFGIAIRDASVFLSDGSAGTIREISSNGLQRVVASGLNTPSAIAFLPDGDLIIADTGSNTIRKLSADGTVSILAGIENKPGSDDGPERVATFNAPIGLAVTGDGGIYVSDTYNDRIRLIRDGVVSTVAGSVRGYDDGIGTNVKFDTPLGVAVWGDRLLVADSGNARIRIIEKNGIVSTLAGSDDRDLIDGPLAGARFVDPTSMSVDALGRIFIADGNAIRVIGRRIFPTVETLAGDKRGFNDGDVTGARFNRPSGLAIGTAGQIFIADSDNRAIRILSDAKDKGSGTREATPAIENELLPLANRWPFDPPNNPREIAGTLGEIRGEIGPEKKPVWFHNGLDIAGAYGETARFIRDETVLDPQSAENFGTSTFG
jgi:DNA-binding beta-propeller fold protein YncE